MTLKETAATLLASVSSGDTDSSGGLSFAEAALIIRGLSPSLFVSLDDNGDDELSADELAPKSTNGGCFGSGKSLQSLEGLKDFFGDLFLLGLLATSLVAWRGFASRL